MSTTIGRPNEPRARGTARRIYDSYGLVFLGIIATLFILATIGDHPYGKAISVFLLGAVFLLTLAASSVRRSLLRLATALVVLVVLAAIITSALGTDSVARGASLTISILLVIASPVLIAKRIAHHREISGSTVMGALCIYLFIGLFFALFYTGLDLIVAPDLLEQLPDPTTVDYIYFSFTTMTTLGYGDLSPAFGTAKMAAIIEAIVGQLYLVTVVAVVVGRLGSQRRSQK